MLKGWAFSTTSNQQYRHDRFAMNALYWYCKVYYISTVYLNP